MRELTKVEGMLEEQAWHPCFSENYGPLIMDPCTIRATSPVGPAAQVVTEYISNHCRRNSGRNSSKEWTSLGPQRLARFSTTSSFAKMCDTCFCEAVPTHVT